MQNPIYTETTSCRDCYKCVRSCPVKAIQIKDGNAMIIKDRCIYCGKCVHVCPNNAKKVRNDVPRARLAIASGRKVFCSLAPSYSSEFAGKEDKLLTALKKLGFCEISETAIGAALVTQALDIYASEHDGKCPFIGTACPSVVELVKKYYPEEIGNLAPVPSPLQSHSAYLRSLGDEDIVIVFIGPCIAKKMEADLTPGYPDLAITFDELRSWLEEEDIDLDKIKAEDVRFFPKKAGISSLYPVEGGQIRSSAIWGHETSLQPDAISMAGVENIMSSIADIDSSTPFLELLSCEGGCVNGPGISKKGSLAERKRLSALWTEKRLAEDDLFEGDEAFARKLLKEGYGLLHSEGPKPAPVRKGHTEEEINAALIELGKLTPADELNCGGCGYNTCRDMAAAYLDGMAEIEMCVTKMRKEAQSKVDVLLSTIPTGVVIVDSDLQIADCNVIFLDMFGDMEEGFIDESVLSMIKGLPLESFVPFAEKFREQFYLARPGQYRVHFKDKYLRVTFFLVDEKRLLGAMFEDITNPTIKRETVVKKAEDVIQRSLETVQQIASLLGENAAETEIMLNSLIDAFSVHGAGDDEGTFTEDDGNLT